jgi:hypothetical protein
LQELLLFPKFKRLLDLAEILVRFQLLFKRMDLFSLHHHRYPVYAASEAGGNFDATDILIHNVAATACVE